MPVPRGMVNVLDQLTLFGEISPPQSSTSTSKRVKGRGLDWIDETARALFKPIVVHITEVQGGCPDMLESDIKTDRLAQLVKGEKGICTETEMLAYLCTASMAAPPNNFGFKAYMYLFERWAKRKGIDTSFLGHVEPLQEYEKRELKSTMESIWVTTDKAWRAKHKALELRKES